MKILIILAHPDQNSFNHAIANKVLETLRKDGHQATLLDLYEEGFDPILPSPEILRDADLPRTIGDHCRMAAETDGFIVVHPNWWGMPPAILTGWVDRIMRPGLAYEFVEGDNGEGVPNGLLKANKAIVFNTSNTSTKREDSVFGDPLERIWKDCIFDLCGVTDFSRRMFRIVVTSTEDERKAWLNDVANIVSDCFPKT